MTEQIRAEQTDQGYEPCFGTDRVVNRAWIEQACVDCRYYQDCAPIGKLIAHGKRNNATQATVNDINSLTTAMANSFSGAGVTKGTDLGMSISEADALVLAIAGKKGAEAGERLSKIEKSLHKGKKRAKR